MRVLKWKWERVGRREAEAGLGGELKKLRVKKAAQWRCDVLAAGDFSADIVLKLAVVEWKGRECLALAVQRFYVGRDEVVQYTMIFEGKLEDFDSVVEVIEKGPVVPNSRKDMVVN